MNGIAYNKAVELAMETPCIHNNKKYKVKDFINDEVFIAFYYDLNDLNIYYQTPYVQMCMNSWRKVYPSMKLLYIQVNYMASVYTQQALAFGKRNYPTDSLRVLFCSLFKKAIYLDTDVYLTRPIQVRQSDDWPKVMVINQCSGTCLYSNNVNSHALKRWFEWYESKALDKIEENLSKGIEPMLYTSDIESFIAMNGVIPNSTQPINHFSMIYPLVRDKVHFKIIDTLDPNTNTKFDKECKPAFLQYLKDRGYEDLVDENAEIAISFI